MRRPLQLTIAVVLQWMAAVLAAISAFDFIAAAVEMRRDGVATQIEGALVMQGIVDIPGSAVVAAVFVAGVLLMAIALARVMVAVFLFRGRAWARIVAAILALVNLAGGVAYLFEGYWLRALVVAGFEVLILWLLFSRASSDYIRETALPA